MLKTTTTLLLIIWFTVAGSLATAAAASDLAENRADLYHWFGHAIDGGFDVNGDSVPDIVVGAPDFDGYGKPKCGRVSVFSGSDSCMIRYWEGEAAGDEFGFSVALPGDLDGDGCCDLLIGAPYHDDGEDSEAGKVYIYSGCDFSLIQTLVGSSEGDLFGKAVDGVGDLDDDDVADIIVGAPGTDSGTGFVVVYSPGDDWSIIRSHTANGAYHDSLGIAVAGAGDIDNDGTADYLMSAPYWEGIAGTDRGQVWTISGDDGSDIYPLIDHIGATNNAHYGYSVAGAYLNDDSYADIIVGVPGYSSSLGLVKIYHGLTGTPFTDSPIYGTVAGGMFGFDVANAGDFCGDGNDDLLVGAPAANSNAGKAYVYTFRGTFDDFEGCVTYTGSHSSDRLGYCVAGVGDLLGGDGDDDVAVGAIFAESQGPPTVYGPGRTYVYSGDDYGLLMELSLYTPPLEVYTPNSSSEVFQDCGFTVTWDDGFSSCSPTVKIRSSTNAGATWSAWEAGIDNDGSHAWTAPNAPSDSCLLEICCEAEDWPCVTSDYFTVDTTFVCGDCDNNELVNISDAVCLIGWIFGGGQAPDPYLAGDCDCNGIVNISDAVCVISYIFGGGPAPCDPDDDEICDCHFFEGDSIPCGPCD